MSADIRSQQRWLIAGVTILAVLLILVIVAIIRSVQRPAGSPQIGSRSPVQELAYCGPQDTGLCIVSFGQVEGGDMLVNFQIPRPVYPEFVLVINRYGVESTYVCKKVKGLSTGVTCTGASQAPGEVLQFKVISKRQGTLLAEGKINIIGIAIATPEGVATATVEGTATGPAALTGTPTVSYPNPSYP